MMLLVLACLLIAGPSCSSSDNFALLGGTLRTMQRAACDDEIVALSCPRGTTISIQVAQYGKASLNHSCGSLEQLEDGQRCLWPNAMQYSLLQKVVEACQKKPNCKFSTKPKPGLVDPCPNTRKFVEVAYRCRPYEFRSRTACEDDVIKLSCNPYSRVAVLDAKYGRTAYESITCPQTQGVREQSKEQDRAQACSAPYAAETVMQICHGKRRCTVVANSKTFGTPCTTHSKAYLKVVYACDEENIRLPSLSLPGSVVNLVKILNFEEADREPGKATLYILPLGVLMEKYESASEKDEMTEDQPNGVGKQGLFDDVVEGESDKWETNAVSPVADPALQPLPNDDEALPYGNVEASTSTVHYNVERKRSAPDPVQSKWKLIVSVSLGIAGLLILIGILLGIHCYVNHRSSGSSKTGDMFTIDPPNPNVFIDATSDIDNEDVSHISGTFYDPVHPDMILFRDVPGNKGTLRAMRPLSSIYPCGVSMYGSDYVPTGQRELGPRTFSTEEPPRPRAEVVSPRSLSEYSNSHHRYG